MLWKKRWFVLSEYCLFYYKGPEEDRALGSILLPSYRVSPCSPEDKVFRKFSFKLEHQNMRTYYFASETKDWMTKWMNAMSLASIMHVKSGSLMYDYEPRCDRPSVSSLTSTSNVSADESDSGFHAFQYRRQAGSRNIEESASESSRANTMERLNMSCDSALSGREFSKENKQPLYANAPPKPKRLNTSRDYSTSPERSPDRSVESVPSRGGDLQDVVSGRTYQPYNIQNGMERRTPETYARTYQPRAEYEDLYMSGQENPSLRAFRCKGDYGLPKEMYEGGYRKHSSGISSEHPTLRQNRYQADPYRRFSEMYCPKDRNFGSPVSDIHDRPALPSTGLSKFDPPRPYSADFLDKCSPVGFQPGPPNSEDYWSEEGYADKMRRAVYQQHFGSVVTAAPSSEGHNKSLPDVSNSAGGAPHQHGPFQSTINSAIPHHTAPAMHSPRSASPHVLPSHSTHPHPTLQRAEYIAPSNPVRCAKQLDSSEAVNNCVLGMASAVGRPSAANVTSRLLSAQVISDSHQDRNYGIEGQNNFTRSSSARLTRPRTQEDMHNTSLPDDSHLGENERRKMQQQAFWEELSSYREESMKRLLEWKQRMLQSPLTKKSSPRRSDSPKFPTTNETSVNKPSSPGYNDRSTLLYEYQRNNINSIKSPVGKPTRTSPNFTVKSSVHSEPQSYLPSDFSMVSNCKIYNTNLSPSSDFDSPKLSTQVQDRPSILTKGKSQNRCLVQSSDHEGHEQSSFATHPRQKKRSYNLSNGDLGNNSDSDIRAKQEDLTPAADSPEKVDVSAGDLLGKTHEELVLLLIQLRRQNAALGKNIETCKNEMKEMTRLIEVDPVSHEEHVKLYDELNNQVQEYERQFETGKPLINLVDNMVKLGSLYGSNSDSGIVRESPNLGFDREKSDLSQHLLEEKLDREERYTWKKLTPDHKELEHKVEQLYSLEKVLQQESKRIQSLQKDKEMLEKAVNGVRRKVEESRDNAIDFEKYKVQQRLLERELTRVRTHLTQSAKKLEESAVQNSRIEQELILLRQKVQLILKRNSTMEDTNAQSAAQLESELFRVQKLMEDLQKRRNELSYQVQKLTESKRSDGEQVLIQEFRPSPTGIAGAGPVGRKRQTSTWLETDLDTLDTRDRGQDAKLDTIMGWATSRPVPLYVNTYDGDRVNPELNSVNPQINTMKSTPTRHLQTNGDDYPPPPPPPEQMIQSRDYNSLGYSYNEQENKMRPGYVNDISQADDKTKKYYGILPKEKPLEVKTVRIVKRESERRQKDKSKKVTIEEAPLPEVTEEASLFVEKRHNVSDNSLNTASEDGPAFFNRSMSLPRNYGRYFRERDTHGISTVIRSTAMPKHFHSSHKTGAMYRSDLALLKNSLERKRQTENVGERGRQLTARERLFGSIYSNNPDVSNDSFTSPSLSPVYKSEAAREIVEELMNIELGTEIVYRRQVPLQKRRHHTISSSQPLTLETLSATVHAPRSRDDIDVESSMRPGLSGTPDVVKSAISQRRDLKFNERTIDMVLGAPEKILIPERYIPEVEAEENLSVEEKLHRCRKADSIRRMLSETSALELSGHEEGQELSPLIRKKVEAERKQREQLLALNQILAKEVMERSKVVAASPSRVCSPELTR